ncbi:hypothetical protein AX17_004032 [Amanita inopinata Kibby_2008]|nr:hypothetical protein AX17_004032 [Amanita inopinata Kibby_2008]
MATASSDNTLGLQLVQLQNDSGKSPELDVDASDNAAPSDLHPCDTHLTGKKKEKPYVNPERFKTGGPQREKPSDEELAERMQRIKVQNERIKQRRLDVQADEEAFKRKEQKEHLQNARNRKVQEQVDSARDKNARRKLDQIQSREWDSGKPASAQEFGDTIGEVGASRVMATSASSPMSPSTDTHWSRGRSRGRSGRGMRGRGRGWTKGTSPVIQNDGSPHIAPSAQLLLREAAEEATTS